MAGSPADKHRELTNALSTLTERIDQSREDSALLRRQLDEERALGRERDREIAALRQENALLRQRLDDHLKRVETWSGRLWVLVTVLVGAVLSLASGLIVALAKK